MENQNGNHMEMTWTLGFIGILRKVSTHVDYHRKILHDLNLPEYHSYPTCKILGGIQQF